LFMLSFEMNKDVYRTKTLSLGLATRAFLMKAK